jgi:nicotinate-nucleotide pyrophosphorylase (carboxylating)
VSKRAAAPRLRISADLKSRLRDALREDIGQGDITTCWTVPARMHGRGRLIAKAQGVLCGAPVADAIWKLASPTIRVHWHTTDGSRTHEGQVLAELEGPYPALLAGERVALNFLQRLSGVATLTRRFVDAVGGGPRPAICDTRKTTPLWRDLERYAVAVGGGVNHRFGLFDMVLIKENHARAAGGVGEAVRLARVGRARARRRVLVAAEAVDAREAAEARDAGADLILLDNMQPAQARRIVRDLSGSGIPVEVSGGIHLRNVAAYGRTGVDRISIGSLTHSAAALDLSLQLEPAPPKSRR